MAKKKSKDKKLPPLTTGGIKSPDDYRDVPLAAVSTPTASLPTSFFVDISKLPFWHQRAIGACVGHAGGKNKQSLDYMETGKVLPLSARFLYALAKCRDGYKDEGTYPRLVAQIMKDVGVATENTVPNDTTLSHEDYVYNRKESNIPGWNSDPKKSWPDASPFKIKGYAFANVKDRNDLKNAVVNFGGAMLLMRVGEEWWTKTNGTSSWKEKDILPLRAPKVIVSGHEVYLYGYEDIDGRTKFYFMNSWSEEWGMKGVGYFWFDEYVKYLDEAITLVDLPNEIKDVLKELPTKESFSYKFKNIMKKGQSGPDIVALQTALMIDGQFDKQLYISLLKTNELGYFGTTTAKAIYDYCMKHKVASKEECDYVLNVLGGQAGPKTIAHLNKWTSK